MWFKIKRTFVPKNKMKKLTTLYFLLFSVFAFAQKTESLRIKSFKVAQLSDSLKETSGLNFFGDQLFTFNDSGNTSELFEMDKNSGRILNVLETGLKNVDWEALTNDGEHFYIGDFGNNEGTRKALKIYKVPFKKDSVQVDSIKTVSFYYPEQTEFSSKNLNTDFDAEAMIFLDGKIHLFTKEWASRKTTHYTINPEISENQPAQKTETFDTGFVVTDASYFEKKLYLVGYTKMTQVYLMIFDEAEDGMFFSSEAKKYHLGSSLSIGQIEGIAVNEDGIYISSEAFKSPLGKVPQSFYFIPKEKLR